MKDLVIIIHTCDKYSFCWEGWNHYFQKNWDHLLNIPVYFVNENSDITFENVIQFKTGNGEWSDRLLKFLHNSESKNILYFQEDMWLLNKIDIQKYYDFFNNNNLDALRLLNEVKGSNINYYFDTPYGDQYLKFSKQSPYILSHQPSIWKKDFFIKCLKPKENPWDNEVNGSMRINLGKETPKIYTVRNLSTWYIPVSNKGELTEEGKKLLLDI